jgi:hypothetical protein
MRMQNNPVSRFDGRFLLAGTLAILISALDQGPRPAWADSKQSKSATEQNAPAPAPKSKSAAKKSRALPKPHPQASKYTTISAAMHKMEQAWQQLAQAKPVYGDRRIAAMELVATAYDQLNAGLQGVAGPVQPDMVTLRPLPTGKDFRDLRSILSKIHQAQQKLQKAPPLLGNTSAAIATLSDAMAQVEEAMQVARRSK